MWAVFVALSDRICVLRVHLAAEEIYASENDFIAADVGDIALSRVVVKGTIQDMPAVLVIDHARAAGERGYVQHMAAAFMRIIHPVAQIDMSVTAQPDDIAVSADKLTEAAIAAEYHSAIVI